MKAAMATDAATAEANRLVAPQRSSYFIVSESGMDPPKFSQSAIG